GNYLNRATAHEAVRNVREALADIDRAIELEPRYAIAWRIKGRLLLKTREPTKAEAAYREAIRLKPDVAEAHLALARFLYDQGKFKGAIAACRNALSVEPNNFDLQCLLAVVLQRQERWAEAAVALKRAVRIKPKAFQPHIVLAQLLTHCPDLKVRAPKRAVREASKAVELAPKSASAWRILGEARFRAGAWNGAIVALEKSVALRDDPREGDSRPWFFLAMAHRKLGNESLSDSWYDKAVEWMEKNKPEEQ